MRPLSHERAVSQTWTTSQAHISTENQLQTGCLRAINVEDIHSRFASSRLRFSSRDLQVTKMCN